MNRDTIFARKPKTRTVEIDGDKLIIRKLSQGETETLKRSYSSPEKALEGARFIFARTVVDEEGKRVFTDDDLKRLSDVDFDLIHTVAQAAMEFSGLVKTDPKVASAD
ncbi:MAG: hypothetical protein QM770_10880 [Tepidisphaeraceae bacterium]